MGVLVCYDDFTYDVVNDYHLDYLIDTGCIIGFDKSGDWAKVEVDEEDATPPPRRMRKKWRRREKVGN